MDSNIPESSKRLKEIDAVASTSPIAPSTNNADAPNGSRGLGGAALSLAAVRAAAAKARPFIPKNKYYATPKDAAGASFTPPTSLRPILSQTSAPSSSNFSLPKWEIRDRAIQSSANSPPSSVELAQQRKSPPSNNFQLPSTDYKLSRERNIRVLSQFDQGSPYKGIGGRKETNERSKHQTFAPNAKNDAKKALDSSRARSLSLGRQSTAAGISVTRLTFHYDPPVQSCKLTPYFLVETTNGTQRPKNEQDNVQYRWYRGERCVCVMCGKRATIQCLSSLKAEVPSEESFLCSSKCMRANFKRKKGIFDQHHHMLTNTIWDPDPDVEDPNGSLFSRAPPAWKDKWTLIDRERSYKPKKMDVGCRLRLDAGVGLNPLKWSSLLTTSVLKEPDSPPLRRMLTSAGHMGNSQSNYKVICYNVLAEIYATGYMYPYCPLWALQWDYRSQRILRDILTYRASIVCLQEVQENHFKNFFRPELSKYGYDAVFKRKTRESRSSDPGAVDGCAIFFERKRFALRKQHDVEFNADVEMHLRDRADLRRMMKGNIAIIIILEELGVRHHNGAPSRICIANTHIYWDPEFKDVKLWQTMMLTQHLQRILQREKIPLILCGDFNSEVDSAVYHFLNENMIGADHPIMKDEIVQDLFYHVSIEHHLPLQSAYSVIGEPKYTNYTGHYVGTLDYIWFSHDMLEPVAVLELYDEEVLKKYTALPSPLHPSDHLPLVAEFVRR